MAEEGMFCRFSYVLRVGEGVGYSMLEYPRYGTVKSGYKLQATSYQLQDACAQPRVRASEIYYVCPSPFSRRGGFQGTCLPGPRGGFWGERVGASAESGDNGGSLGGGFEGVGRGEGSEGRV